MPKRRHRTETPIPAAPHSAPRHSDWDRRLQQAAEDLTPASFISILDEVMRSLLQEAVANAQAHEGTLWLADATRNGLVPVFNTGPQAGRIVGKFRQPFQAGLISMVYASEQPFLENQVQKNSRQSKQLDKLLQVQTESLLVVPFYYVHACRGVLSCVQLARRGSKAPVPSGFQTGHLSIIHQAAQRVGQLVERRLMLLALDLPWR